MYEIKVLNSEEFDKVAKLDPRYSYVDGSNLGFADREKGLAYVRGSNIHDLNKYLINHELEELEMDESTHQDPNGIRHKKFKDFLRVFYNPINLPIPGLQNQDKGTFHMGEGEKSQTVTGGMGGLEDSPFGRFFSSTVSGAQGEGTASPRVSETVTGGIQTGIGQSGNGIEGLPPDLLQRLKGNYSGRITF